jgi:hypothetical protein
MTMSEKTRTRLVVLSVGLWFATGFAVLSFLGGPHGAVERYLRPVQNELGGWTGLALGRAGIDPHPLPGYELQIEPRVFRAAELFSRENRRLAAASDRWWFPARFVAEGRAYDVDVRFAGRNPAQDPVLERAWRIRFREGQGYRGLREVALHPADQQHTRDLVVRDTARRLGLLAPPAGLATFSVNGAAAGAYFWSEAFSTAMLERLGFPKGEIVTPRSSAAASSAMLSGVHGESMARGHYANAIDRGSDEGPALEQLARLLTLLRSNDDAAFEREAAELLDVEKFLTWNALVSIYGDSDADGFAGLSWYFDPVTGLLEPVVHSVERTAGVPAAIGAPAVPNLTERLLSAPSFRTRRNEIVWQLTGGGAEDLARSSDELLGDVLTRLARSSTALSDLGGLREIAEFRRSTRAALRQRAEALADLLADSQVDTVPRLSVTDGTPTLTLDVSPSGLAAIEVSELRFELGEAELRNHQPAAIRLLDPAGRLQSAVTAEPVVVGSSVALRPDGLRLRGGDADSLASTWTVEVQLPFLGRGDWKRSDGFQAIGVLYRNAVTGEALPTAELVGSRTAALSIDDLDAVFLPIDAVIAASGLPLALLGEEIVLPAGDHRLRRTLIVPRSARLRLEPGVRLSLDPDVSIISFRGIIAEGTADEPIVLYATDPDRPWGTVAAARARDTSRFAFVTVSGGSGADFAGIEFDGQLSFNASEIVLRDSEIYDAHGADGVSLKRTTFEVSRTQFITNGSDGLDAEWSSGVVSESLFVNNGDDGLDLADSDVRVTDSAFHWMGDKSISAGARSRVSIDSTRLSDSEIAIASKEESQVDVRNSEFRRNRLGFAVYRDKPVFGGGTGTVTGGLFASNNRDFSVEPGSQLKLIEVQRDPQTPLEPVLGSLALRRVVTRTR